MSSPAPRKLAYIVGSARSGSTILGALLGLQPGMFFAGEVYKLWEEGIQAGYLCSCGQSLSECETWGPLLAGVADGEYASLARSMAKRLAPSSKTRYLPFSLPIALAGLGRRLLALSLQEPLGILQRVYLGLAERTQSRVIVDTSKFPLYASILAELPALELYLIHLVRDPHAVAYSWQRTLYDPGRHRQFGRHGSFTSSFLWTTWNAAIELMRRRNSILRQHYLPVKYEDFVQDPTSALARITQFLGEDAPRPGRLTGNQAWLPEQHSLSGNPVRFARGPVDIRSDDEWRTGLSAASRVVVALTTWPLLAHYGYGTRLRKPSGVASIVEQDLKSGHVQGGMRETGD